MTPRPSYKCTLRSMKKSWDGVISALLCVRVIAVCARRGVPGRVDQHHAGRGPRLIVGEDRICAERCDVSHLLLSGRFFRQKLLPGEHK